MLNPMRDKVLRALAIYADGGSIGKALDEVGLGRGDFYRAKRADPDLAGLYVEIQEARADMMVDEAYEISVEPGNDPKLARVSAQIRLDIARLLDQKRFGQKLGITVSSGDVTEALALGVARAIPSPTHDLTLAITAEYEAVPSVSAPDATDKQSVDVVPNDAAPGAVDIFG